MMIGTELINEFVETIIYTGFLKDDPPQSTMLIASPESGKTSVVSSKQVRSVLICSDMIGSGLLQELSGKPYVRHIIVNDMIAVMAHKPVTNQRTWAVMSALMEEGLGKQIMPGELSRDFGGRRGGFICCIPSELVSDHVAGGTVAALLLARFRSITSIPKTYLSVSRKRSSFQEPMNRKTA